VCVCACVCVCTCVVFVCVRACVCVYHLLPPTHILLLHVVLHCAFVVFWSLRVMLRLAVLV